MLKMIISLDWMNKPFKLFFIFFSLFNFLKNPNPFKLGEIGFLVSACKVQ